MKKLILFSLLSFLSLKTFAQEQQFVAPATNGNTIEKSSALKTFKVNSFGSNKSAGLTDTFTLATDSMIGGVSEVVYYEAAVPLDSGLLYGTNSRELKGFAYLYNADFDASGSTPDTTVQILGFYSKWAGRIQTTSTKQVTFSVWSRGTNKIPVPSRPVKFYVYGTPAALYSPSATRTVNIATFPTTGAGVLAYLTAPITNIASSIYVGYTTNYTWAGVGTDTFGLRTTSIAGAEPNFYTVTAGDTLLSANAVVQLKDGTWTSVRYNLGIGNGDPIIAPLVQINCPKCGLGVGGFRSKNLTAYGNFPNPAVNTTNVKFSITRNAKVTLTIVDNLGRDVRTYDLGAKVAGEYVVPVSVENLSTGNYAYVLQTSDGDIIAAQMSVIK
jgi:hypothetical protein